MMTMMTSRTSTFGVIKTIIEVSIEVKNVQRYIMTQSVSEKESDVKQLVVCYNIN